MKKTKYAQGKFFKILIRVKFWINPKEQATKGKSATLYRKYQ